MTEKNAKMSSDKNNGVENCEAEDEGQQVVAIPSVTLMDILKDPEAVKAIEGLIVNVFVGHNKNSFWHRIFLLFCFLALIGCVTFLSYSGKLDPTAGVILGALAGYLFGKDE